MFSNPKAKIFELLNKHSDLVVKAANLLNKSIHSWSRLSNYAQELYEIENEADKIIDEIADDVERKFILPLDKEDVKILAERLDDIIDGIEGVVNRCLIYNLKSPYEGMLEFAEIIQESCQKIDRGVTLLAKQEFDKEEFVTIYKKIRQLEKAGDKHYRKILAKMMKNPDITANAAQVWEVIKWKEIWGKMENLLDRCEALAILFESFRIKYE